MNTETAHTGNSEQWSAEAARERLRADVSGPDENEGVVVKGLTLHFTQEQLDYAERIAWYRNFRADALGVRLATRWSRKSVLESWARSAANNTREKMAELEADHGPLPTTKEDVRAYAAVVAAAEASSGDDK